MPDRTPDMEQPAALPFPRRLFTGALLLTSLVLGVLAWGIFRESTRRVEQKLESVHLDELRWHGRHHVEAMIQSARMFALTGLPRWRVATEAHREQLLERIDVEIDHLAGEPVVTVLRALRGQTEQLTDRLAASAGRPRQEVLAFLDGEELRDLGDAFERILARIEGHNISRLTQLAGDILRFHEMRTMATRLAAETGEERWEATYRRVTPKLDNAVAEAALLIDDDVVHKRSIERIRAAGYVLRNWDDHAFADMRQGQHAAVRTTFDQPAYQRHSLILDRAVGELTSYLRQRGQGLAARQTRSRDQKIVVLVSSLGVLLFLWVYVSRSIRSWHGTLSAAIERSQRAEQGLRQAQEHLEQRVQERTRELVESQTAQQQLSERLAQAHRLESIGRLAGGVSHDFNNLLTVIRGNAELLQMDLPAGTQEAQDIEQILQTCDRAKSLTRQLLAFSRQQVMSPHRVDLNGTITQLRNLLTRLLGDDVALETVLAGDLPMVRVDPSQVERVLMNLTVNARDAVRGQGEGRIVVRTSRHEFRPGQPRPIPGMDPGTYACVAVGDNGAGMDADTLDQIYEPFFTTKTEGGGTGLGLATVYGIIKQSGGHIDVESIPGAGTTFSLFFGEASSHAETPSTPPPSTAPAARRGEGACVLVAEDQDEVRGFVVRLLERSGYRVLQAADGSAGLEVARQHIDEIDVLLTDVMMPGMRGPELARQVRALSESVHVIFMSGYAAEELGSDGGALDATLLHKPLVAADLLRSLEECLALSS
jgi:signal transduction histidine kinase/CheY-like chemotaxis protein